MTDDANQVNKENTMSNLQELKQAIELLENQDIGQLKHALSLIGEPVAETQISPSAVPFEIGKSYFIRTVTYFQVGRVTRIVGNFVEMEDASWIADTGRFMDALKSGNFSEVEPVGKAGISMAAIVDYFPFEAKLPTEQK